MSTTILIVDDHALFRTGLQLILSQSQNNYVALEASSIMEAVAFSESEVDAIFLDIQMPGLNGLDGLKVIQHRFPEVPVVIISASDSTNDQQIAYERGARGFLHKSSSAEDIFSCLETVLAGQSANLITDFPDKVAGPTSSAIGEELTPRQLEVLNMLCQGKSNKLIARNLGMAENTVRVHVSAILSILNASSRTEASLIAQQRKIISLPL
ncbi:MAG: response regulator transcription factor [Acidiferrobacterales bacterium]|nr:response regulator transcription factor [Acidiferrobacterales bacterium]